MQGSVAPSIGAAMFWTGCVKPARTLALTYKMVPKGEWVIIPLSPDESWPPLATIAIGSTVGSRSRYWKCSSPPPRSSSLYLVIQGDFVHFLHFWLFVHRPVRRPVWQPGHLSTKRQKCKHQPVLPSILVVEPAPKLQNGGQRKNLPRPQCITESGKKRALFSIHC